MLGFLDAAQLTFLPEKFNMMLKSSFRTRRPQNVKRSKATRRQMFMEQLEDRRMLAAVSWTGGGGDLLWSNPANWSTAQLPGPNDDVTVEAEGAVTIAYDILGPASIRSLDLKDSLVITNGAINILHSFTNDTGVTISVIGAGASFS